MTGNREHIDGQIQIAQMAWRRRMMKAADFRMQVYELVTGLPRTTPGPLMPGVVEKAREVVTKLNRRKAVPILDCQLPVTSCQLPGAKRHESDKKTDDNESREVQADDKEKIVRRTGEIDTGQLDRD